MRFDVLQVTTNSKEDFPMLKADVQNGAAKQASIIIWRSRTNGRTVPTFAKIGQSGKGEMLSRGGRHCHPLLGVVADDNDDKIFTERTKDSKGICMKERAGNYEHRQLYHDRPLCALPQQTDSRQSLAGLVAWMAVSPHMLVQDHAIQETDASPSGLNCASATGDPIHPEPQRTETAALDTRREFEGNDVSGSTSGSGTWLGKATVQLWTHGGIRRRLLRVEQDDPRSELDERRRWELPHGLVGDAEQRPVFYEARPTDDTSRIEFRGGQRRGWQTSKKENMLNHLQLQEKNPIEIMKIYMETERFQRGTSGTQRAHYPRKEIHTIREDTYHTGLGVQCA